MVWSKLLGGLAALGVVVGIVGSLVGLASTLATDPAALAVFGLVVAVVAAVVGSGLLGRANELNPYW